MKRSLILFLLPIAAHSQGIPKFSNAIIAKGVTFKQIKSALLDSAYFIDQQNEEDGTIITKPKGVCDCKNKDFNQLIIFVRIKDSSATFSGKFNFNYNYNQSKGGLFSNDKNEFQQLEYWKSGISVPHHIFLKLDGFVRGLSSQITYVKL